METEKKIYFLFFKKGEKVSVRKGFINSKINLRAIGKDELVSIRIKKRRILIKKQDIYTNHERAYRRMNEYYLIKNFKRKEGNRCAYCGKIITEKEDLTVDHIKPLSKGGTWERKNLVISCKQCNQNKGSIDVFKHINIEIKSQILKENAGRKSNYKSRKVGLGVKHDIDNIMEIAKRDSNVWNINAFFSKKPKLLMNKVSNISC